MRSTLLLLTLAITLAVSCNKKDKPAPNPPEPPVTGETVRTRIRLSGDIFSSESPLSNGRKVGDAPQYEKGLRDSTLYAVIVRMAGWPSSGIASGLFDNKDSIVVDLPVEGEFKISVIAYKRGSGPGLYYEWKDGVPYFDEPFNSSLTNSMRYGNHIYMHDSLYNLRLFDPLDSTTSLPVKYIAEVDGYRGSKVVDVAEASSIVTLEMKRMAFGVKFSADNFTAGKLHAEFIYYGVILSKTVTPETIGEYFIYTSHDFTYRGDTLFPINVRMTWEKPDGVMVPLGEKPVSFKRNILTTIRIAIPASGGGIILDPIITESDWSATETVEF